MSNSTSFDDLSENVLLAVSYIPLVIITLGLVGNTTSFIIFTFHKEMNKYSSMVYLSFIAIFDTLGLFIWNLDHFILPNFKIQYAFLDVTLCKIAVFVQYQSLQASGLLYSMLTIDRYFTVISRPGSFVSRLKFGTRKSAYLWSAIVILIVVLINLHLLIFNGYIENIAENKTIANGNETITVVIQKSKVMCYAAKDYEVVPMWDKVQAVLYTFVPFIIMLIFNSLLIINVLGQKKESLKGDQQKNEKRKKKLTISLLTITFFFIIMTSPGTIGYGFFVDELYSSALGHAIAIVFDSMMFFQQTFIFIISYLTNKKFADIVNQKVCCRKIDIPQKASTTALTKLDS